jgi:hypothetical protein
MCIIKLPKKFHSWKGDQMLQEFPIEMHSSLGYYVYRLIDPRNGLTFYVGKGIGNRVFAHVKGALNLQGSEDNVSEKISKINEIKFLGLEPIHIIHRHGLTEDEAFAVEAALIDANPGLTNIVSGKYSNEFGPAHVSQLISRYAAQVLEPSDKHNLMLININNFIDGRSVYERVRLAWVASIKKAQKADFILAISNGICIDVFVAAKWDLALVSNFPTLEEDMPKRIGFEGNIAPDNIRSLYKNKRLPLDMLAKKGAANPVRYFYSH